MKTAKDGTRMTRIRRIPADKDRKISRRGSVPPNVTTEG